eukprot:13015-Heterococcus_DN1.PRE.2
MALKFTNMRTNINQAYPRTSRLSHCVNVGAVCVTAAPINPYLTDCSLSAALSCTITHRGPPERWCLPGMLTGAAKKQAVGIAPWLPAPLLNVSTPSDCSERAQQDLECASRPIVLIMVIDVLTQEYPGFSPFNSDVRPRTGLLL